MTAAITVENAREDPREATLEVVREALRTHDLDPLGAVLADDVRWFGAGPGGCRSRDEVLATLRARLAAAPPRLRGARLAGEHAVLELAPFDGGRERWLALRFDADGAICELLGYASEATLEHDLALLAGDAPAAGAGEAVVSALVPFAHVADVARSIAFYECLGFAVAGTYEPHGETVWASLRSADAQLMVARASAPVDAGAQAVLFYLYARDLGALRERLLADGVVPSEIVDGTPGPRREMRVIDPDGYCLMIAEIETDT